MLLVRPVTILDLSIHFCLTAASFKFQTSSFKGRSEVLAIGGFTHLPEASANDTDLLQRRRKPVVPESSTPLCRDSRLLASPGMGLKVPPGRD